MISLGARALRCLTTSLSLLGAPSLGMAAQVTGIASRLTASALSLLTESAAEETTAARARSASSELTSLAPSPKKPRRDEMDSLGDFRSPIKATGLPTPSPTSNSSQGATSAAAPAPQKPVRRMPRASLQSARPDPQNDAGEYLQAGLYWTGSSEASASSRTVPPEPQKLNRSASMRARKADLDWRLIKQPASFPMPMYYGATLLEEERDFRLSLDILRDLESLPREGKGVIRCKEDEDEWRTAQRLKLESSQLPPPYRKIRQSECRRPHPRSLGR